MHRSRFRVPAMDCAAEEQLVRMGLDRVEGVSRVDVDLTARTVTVHHRASPEAVADALRGLGLGAVALADAEVRDRPGGAAEGAGRRGPASEDDDTVAGDPEARSRRHALERRVLWAVLLINAGFFVLEGVAGLLAGSMGLVADGLDMLADAFVYGMSLMVVGGTQRGKRAVARWSGVFQLALAVLGFAEVVRRVVGLEPPPDVPTMIAVAALALVGNAVCLVLLQRARSDEVHLRASMIFTSNDVIINLGVIAAGLLVWGLGSSLPDLVVGAVVFLLVIRGAVRILRLAR